MGVTAQRRPSDQDDPAVKVPNICEKSKGPTPGFSSTSRDVFSICYRARFLYFLTVAVSLLLVAEYRYKLLTSKLGAGNVSPTAGSGAMLSWYRTGGYKVDDASNAAQERSQHGAGSTAATAGSLEMCPPVPPYLGESRKLPNYLCSRFSLAALTIVMNRGLRGVVLNGIILLHAGRPTFIT